MSKFGGFAKRGLLTLALAGVAGATTRADEPTFVDQGSKWTSDARAAFYTTDQGSEMIPLAWLKALKQPSGEPFLDGALARFGYLPMPSISKDLPVGFTTRMSVVDGKTPMVGMNCSACHTRQISVAGKDYRIDGGPGIVDFQSLLADMDASMAAARSSDAAFLEFAKTALDTPNPAPAQLKDLRKAVDLWFLRFDTLMQHALPRPAWGPGRLDAVAMIFDRVTGLDIGPAPSFLIEANILPADAPVRYPFLWNAAIQDRTQWPGFARNGDDLLGLVRNLGEVYGVFGVFQPKKVWPFPAIINFLNNNSANFAGLLKLEDLIQEIGPPKYPWKVDQALADKGKDIYGWSTAKGGCIECHDIKPGTPRGFGRQTRATPLLDVGTDSREYQIVGRLSQTGVYKGFGIPNTRYTIGASEKSFDVLAISVIGSLGQAALRYAQFLPGLAHQQVQSADTGWTLAALGTKLKDLQALLLSKLPPQLDELRGAFSGSLYDTASEQANEPYKGKGKPASSTADAPPKFVYESRVMQGIWAAAPYLHDGSVPTLADLLLSPDKRPTSFAMGPNYDIDNLGIAKDQTMFNQTIVTGCTGVPGTAGARDSGSSNCGHDYGTSLSDDDKKALLEYLKVL